MSIEIRTDRLDEIKEKIFEILEKYKNLGYIYSYNKPKWDISYSEGLTVTDKVYLKARDLTSLDKLIREIQSRSNELFMKYSDAQFSIKYLSTTIKGTTFFQVTIYTDPNSSDSGLCWKGEKLSFFNDKSKFRQYGIDLREEYLGTQIKYVITFNRIPKDYIYYYTTRFTESGEVPVYKRIDISTSIEEDITGMVEPQTFCK